MNNYLMHHGVKGQKWGVRRYQNPDGSRTALGKRLDRLEYTKGSYTRKGVQNYRKSIDQYNAAVDKYNSNQNYDTYNSVKKAQMQMKKDRKQIRKDIKADKGKDLYQKGKVVERYNKYEAAAGLIASGSAIAAKYLYNKGNTKYAVAALAAGGATLAATTALAEIQKNKLRAYYGHSR